MRALTLFLLALSTFPVCAGKYATQLATECDELLRLAITRPYGLAWTESGGDDEGKNKTPKLVTLDAGASPAAGLILFYAGEFLNQPKYTHAARDVGRAIAASQHPTGKIPPAPLFNITSAANRDPLAPLPDRASTRASLALLLTLLEDHAKEPANELLLRSASRAAQWVIRQQADSGGWPVLEPLDAPVAKQSRITRLDTRDYRDSTFTMLLVYEVLGDTVNRRSAERAIEFLNRAANPESLPFGPSAWGPAYTLTGAPVDKVADLPKATDLLATRYALQTTLGLYMVLGGGPHYIRCQKVAESLAALPKAGDRFNRWYTPKGDFYRPENLEAPAVKFGQGEVEDTRWVGDFGLPPVLQTIQIIGPAGREKFLDRLTPHFTRTQILAHSAAGLEDGNIPWDFPSTPVEVPPYLAAHAETFEKIEAATPPELQGRIAKLWALYLRAKIERVHER